VRSHDRCERLAYPRWLLCSLPCRSPSDLGIPGRQTVSPSPRLVVQHATATKVATEGAMGRRTLHVELPAKFCVSPPGERTAHSAGFVPMRGSVSVGRR